MARSAVLFLSALAFASVALVSRPASASSTARMICENGSVNAVGDAHVSLKFTEDTVVFSRWETSYEIPLREFVVTGPFLVALGKRIVSSSEGTEYVTVVNLVIAALEIGLDGKIRYQVLLQSSDDSNSTSARDWVVKCQ